MFSRFMPEEKKSEVVPSLSLEQAKELLDRILGHELFRIATNGANKGFLTYEYRCFINKNAHVASDEPNIDDVRLNEKELSSLLSFLDSKGINCVLDTVSYPEVRAYLIVFKNLNSKKDLILRLNTIFSESEQASAASTQNNSSVATKPTPKPVPEKILDEIAKAISKSKPNQELEFSYGKNSYSEEPALESLNLTILRRHFRENDGDRLNYIIYTYTDLSQLAPALKQKIEQLNKQSQAELVRKVTLVREKIVTALNKNPAATTIEIKFDGHCASLLDEISASSQGAYSNFNVKTGGDMEYSYTNFTLHNVVRAAFLPAAAPTNSGPGLLPAYQLSLQSAKPEVAKDLKASLQELKALVEQRHDSAAEAARKILNTITDKTLAVFTTLSEFNETDKDTVLALLEFHIEELECIPLNSNSNSSSSSSSIKKK